MAFVDFRQRLARIEDPRALNITLVLIKYRKRLQLSYISICMYG